MRARDDNGLELNAEFSVAADGPLLSVFLESAGGHVPGSDRPRNDQYVPILALLLSRLRDRQAVLVCTLVASARSAALPEDDRTVLRGPLALAGVRDIERLRLDITTGQGRIGRPAEAGNESNNRKRLQLRVEVPGYGPGDASRLEQDLARQRHWQLPAAADLLRALVGEEITTVTGQPNMVLAVHGDAVLVRTRQSPDGQPVAVSEVQAGLDRLAAQGSVRVSVPELGYRSAFVGAVLATLPGAVLTRNPAVITLTSQPSQQGASDPDFAVFDGVAQVKVRREQAQLRSLLAEGRETAPCALCGHEFPMELLVAAHIKKRSLCSDDERRDLRHVAMLACALGCDALYEAGWITGDPAGRITTVPPAHLSSGRLREHLQELAERHCAAHGTHSEAYFAWHRTTVFREREVTGLAAAAS